MAEREYRQDDQTIGYCPLCWHRLSAITTAAKGYCDVHGWQWCEWNRPKVARHD